MMRKDYGDRRRERCYNSSRKYNRYISSGGGRTENETERSSINDAFSCIEMLLSLLLDSTHYG